jgi:DNA-binding transcriptional ArsR family regulator
MNRATVPTPTDEVEDHGHGAKRPLPPIELAEATGEGLSTVSQRLKVLRSEGLIARRRDGKHILYSLADAHVAGLLAFALEHAQEARR